MNKKEREKRKPAHFCHVKEESKSHHGDLEAAAGHTWRKAQRPRSGKPANGWNMLKPCYRKGITEQEVVRFPKTSFTGEGGEPRCGLLK